MLIFAMFNSNTQRKGQSDVLNRAFYYVLTATAIKRFAPVHIL